MQILCHAPSRRWRSVSYLRLLHILIQRCQNTTISGNNKLVLQDSQPRVISEILCMHNQPANFVPWLNNVEAPCSSATLICWVMFSTQASKIRNDDEIDHNTNVNWGESAKPGYSLYFSDNWELSVSETRAPQLGYNYPGAIQRLPVAKPGVSGASAISFLSHTWHYTKQEPPW